MQDRTSNHHSSGSFLPEGLCTTIFESMPVGVLVTDTQGKHVFVNQRAASMTEYSVRELMQGVWMVHPDDTEARLLFESALRDGTPGNDYETRYVRKSGSAFWVSICWNPLRDKSGRLAGLCTVFTDISDRKEAQEAFEKASARYSRFADNASDIFFEWDLDGEIGYVSPAIQQLGYTPEELVGTNIFDLTADPAASRARRNEHLSHLRPRRYELQLVSKRRSKVWMEAQIDFASRDGTPAFVHAVMRNISDRKTAEEELRQASERYRMLAENSTDLLWTLDLTGTITYVSPAVRRLGYEPQDWIGHHPFEFIAPEEFASFTERMSEDAIKNLHPEAHPLHIRRKDGSMAWLEVMRDVSKVDGVPVAIQGVARDITERKQAEEELAHLNQRYQEMAENSADTFWEMDPDGTFTYVSPALRHIGYEPEEWVGHNLLEFLVPDDIPAFSDKFEEAHHNPKPALYEFRVRDKNGDAVWIEAMVNYVFSEGTLVRRYGVARNVTERKETEEALRESEDRFKNLSSVTTEGIMIYEEGVILDANKAFADLLGYHDPDELIGKRGLEAVQFTPESLELVREHILSCATDNYEIEFTNREGHVIPAETSGRSILYRGRAARLITLRNISDRLDAEAALRESEQRYKSIVENSTDLIMLGTADGSISYASPAARTVVGYEPDELVKDTPWIIHPEDDERMRTIFQRALRGDSGASVEYRIRTKAGETRWVSHSYSPIMDGTEVQTIVSVVRDVTERKEAETALRRAQEALRESEERYKSIVENSSDLILLNAPDASIVYASPALRDMLGYEPEEFVGTTPDVLHPDDVPLVHNAFERAAKGNSESNFEYRLFTKSGEIKWVSHAWSPVYAGDTLNGVISVVRDITERKQSEERLRKAHAELEQAYMIQREFLNNVTHEVRTPLTAVQGYTEMLMEGIAGPVSKEQAELLQRVASSSEHLLDVLNAVLQTASMKSGRVALRPRVSDPRLIVKRCTSAVLPQARKKGLNVTVHPDPDGTVATYDAEKLTIIVTNLLGNAVKFTASGSIDVFVTARPDGCEIVVADTGIGIAQSALTSIFDEFSQLDYPGKHKPSGFGLGLSIVAAATEAIGASLIVSTEKGLGAAFTLSVPALES